MLKIGGYYQPEADFFFFLSVPFLKEMNNGHFSDIKNIWKGKD